MLFEVGDAADFRVGADGVVYTRRPLRLADRKRAHLLVYARDRQANEEWRMYVHFLLRPGGGGTEHTQVQGS